ncbi:MAG: extracellular solute-binding protein [Lachnospiraceae bacterium]|nr:extracellular solute-binding protein [Lachnospiraceae bacterium]
MKRGKKWCASVLTAALLAGLLGGCGSPKEDGNAGTQSGEEGNENTSGENSEAEVFRLTVHSSPAQGDWNDYWLIRTIEEKFHVDIQVEMISSDVWRDKLPLMFATEKLPDFFLNSLDASDIATYGSEGYLLDLNPYISQEKTPNIWKAMEETPALRAALSEAGGEIYAVGGADMAEANLAQNRFYVNYQWAEQILGKQPETLDEFYEYLKGVKEKDMNGNGDATDEIPLGGFYKAPDMIHVFPPILNAFGYTRKDIEAIDGKVVYVPAEDNYRHFLEFMKKLYGEELLDNEFFSQTQDQVNAKETNYRYGAYSFYASWVNQPEESIWRQYDIQEPLTSQYNGEKKVAAVDINKCGNFSITKNCSNPEKLMEILDWCFSFEGYLTILGGFEKGTEEGQEAYGYTYQWVDENTLDMQTEFDESKWDNQNSWTLAEICPDYGYFPIYRNFNMQGSGDAQSYLEEGLINHYAPYYHVGWPSSVKLTAEEADELALISTDIQSYTDEMVTKMIIGEIPTDDFESFRTGLKERKLERMLEIYQGAYDRWSARQ